MDVKTCKECGESKPLDAFYKMPPNKDHRTGKCIVCMRQYFRNRRRDRKSERSEKNFGSKDRIFNLLCDLSHEERVRVLIAYAQWIATPKTEKQRIKQNFLARCERLGLRNGYERLESA